MSEKERKISIHNEQIKTVSSLITTWANTILVIGIITPILKWVRSDTDFSFSFLGAASVIIYALLLLYIYLWFCMLAIAILRRLK